MVGVMFRLWHLSDDDWQKAKSGKSLRRQPSLPEFVSAHQILNQVLHLEVDPSWSISSSEITHPESGVAFGFSQSKHLHLEGAEKERACRHHFHAGQIRQLAVSLFGKMRNTYEHQRVRRLRQGLWSGCKTFKGGSNQCTIGQGPLKRADSDLPT